MLECEKLRAGRRSRLGRAWLADSCGRLVTGCFISATVYVEESEWVTSCHETRLARIQLEAQLDDGLLSSGFTLLSRSTEQPPESGNPLE